MTTCSISSEPSGSFSDTVTGVAICTSSGVVAAPEIEAGSATASTTMVITPFSTSPVRGSVNENRTLVTPEKPLLGVKTKVPS